MAHLQEKPLRLVIAGGGTGGHVQPAVAVLQELRQRGIPLEILWIGSRTGTERKAALDAKVQFREVKTGKFRRYASLRTPIDAALVVIGVAQSFVEIRRFRPDVIFGTGGYVSTAGVYGGALFAPILIHEQTTHLGFATRLNRWSADLLALTFPESLEQTKNFRCRVVVTGNPIRQAILSGDAGAGFTHFGLDPALPIVYVTGGARGSSPINRRIEAVLPRLLESMQIVHQTGPVSASEDNLRLNKLRSSLPEHLQRRYVVREFIDDELPDVYAAASLIVARSGAGTVSELAALAKPSLLIPLPHTSGDEQTGNAQFLSRAGAAVVLEQVDAGPERLFQEITALVHDQDRLHRMHLAALSLGRIDAGARLADELLRLTGRPVQAVPADRQSPGR